MAIYPGGGFPLRLDGPSRKEKLGVLGGGGVVTGGHSNRRFMRGKCELSYNLEVINSHHGGENFKN